MQPSPGARTPLFLPSPEAWQHQSSKKLLWVTFQRYLSFEIPFSFITAVPIALLKWESCATAEFEGGVEGCERGREKSEEVDVEEKYRLRAENMDVWDPILGNHMVMGSSVVGLILIGVRRRDGARVIE